MEEHIKLMNHASKNVVPKAILSKLKFISKALKLGRQEDAHEFLLGLLDSMQKNCLGRKSDPSSIVKSIFEGSIQSIVKCRGCKHESKTTDPMMDIALDIKHCHDIKTAFSYYTKKELLTGGNRYFCER
jgi:ubiquitin carboxyl-terminal hydrolase 36/42